MKHARAGIGFRVKTGYAIAIMLAVSPADPELVGREQVLLADLDEDDSRQPFHAALERGDRVGVEVVRRSRRDAERRAAIALAGLMRGPGDGVSVPRAIGLVVGSNVDPATLGNLHIRAHALEGRFYREVLEVAAEARGLRSITLLERDAIDTATGSLHRSVPQLKEFLERTGKVAGRPWRRDEQLATLAAWVALTQ